MINSLELINFLVLKTIVLC